MAMEAFSLQGDTGWQTLSSLLDADVTFSGRYLWGWLTIINQDGSNTMIVKSLPGTTAPSADSGINLGPGDAFTWSPGNQGIIDGRAIWVKCSANPTDLDVTFVHKSGI